MNRKNKNTGNKIIIVGPFPPPVYGMATTNAAVYNHLRALGGKIIIINIANPSLNRTLWSRLKRIVPIVKGLKQFIGIPELSEGTLYMSVSGGYGQIYEIIFIFLAKLKRMRLFVRHVSFAYLDVPCFISRILIKVAGVHAVHVTQCDRMAKLLYSHYNAQQIIPISNAVLYPFDRSKLVPLRTKLCTLGFLSNISVEKGIFLFLDLMSALEAECLPVNALIAGPFQDTETQLEVCIRLEKLQNVEYVGPKYGVDKDAFFEEIDAFVFPTQYKNETEAKVNHEAMSCALPVIAYGRGCIPEIISDECGKVIEQSSPFVPEALVQIKHWIKNPDVFQEASRAAFSCFAETRSHNMQRWHKLLKEIVKDSNDVI